MKKAKRLSALLLAAILLLSTVVQGYAAETVTDTITGKVAAAAGSGDSSADVSADIFDIDVGDAVTDPLLEDYIEENADEEYTDTSDKKLVNYILLKQTFFDADLVDDSDTINSIMTDIEEGDGAAASAALEKYIMQTSGYVAVYELDEDSDYLVAYLGDESSAETREAVFAVNSNEGETVDGCIYDAETGIAYIPRVLLLNDAGEQEILYLQVQLMQLISMDEDTATTTVTVDDGDDILSSTEQKTTFFDTETTVTVDEGLTIASVSVDGAPLSEDYYTYDSESGELTIAQSPTSVQSVSVTVSDENSGLLDKLLSAADSVFTETAQAYTAISSWDDMSYFARNINIGSMSVGSYIDCTVGYSYSDVYQHTSTVYGALAENDGYTAELMSAVDSNTAYSISHIMSLSQAKQTNTAVWLNQGNLSSINSGLGSISSTMVLQCGHISTSLGKASNSATVVNARLRLLATGTDSAGTTYAVFGIITQMTHSQSSVALFKVGTQTKGKAQVKKVSSNTTITSGNSNYSLANAKYQIFKTEAEAKAAATGTNSNNTNRIATLTTDSSGNTETISLDPGTYYIKEIVASKGYKLDTNVYSVTVTNGKTSTVTSTEEPYTGDLKIYKYSEDNSTTDGNSAYSLASGATFGVYTNSVCSGTAVATVSLDQYDSTNKRAYGTASNLPYGTYYVKEITAPKGFFLNSEIKSVVVSSTTAETSFSLSFWDEPITITIELTKETDFDSVAVMSSDGGGQVSDTVKANELALHEDYTLEGAVYGIYSDSDCTKLLHMITTDEDGKGTSSVELPMGTYYVKEITAPEGYELSDEVHTVTADSTVVSESNMTVEVTVSDPLDLGKVIVYKSSSDSSLLEDYPDYYSLEGAVYTVYYECNDNVCSRPAGTITINEDGYGELDGILYSGDDTYVYVQETSAPANFEIDTEVHPVKLTADNDVGIVKSTDTPKTRTFYVYKGPMAMLETGPDFDADIMALAESEGKTLKSIVFTNTKSPSDSTTTIDVSYAQNGGVIAWMVGTTCYVSDVPTGEGDDAGLIYFNYDSSFMFSAMTDIVSIDFGTKVIDTSYATDMNHMFDHVISLKTLDVSEFNTQNVTNMESMFQVYYRSAIGLTAADSSLTSITGLDTLDTSDCTDMTAMFRGCNLLTSIDISNFDTTRVTNFTCMFMNCTSLTSLDLRTFKVGNATDISAMFYNCPSLKSINITGWNTAKVTDMSSIFNGCTALTTVSGLANISTLHVTDAGNMFLNCTNLTGSLIWRCSTTTSHEGMFVRCSTASGTSFTLYGTSATATMAQNMVATKSAASNVSYGGAVSFADTSTLTASADTGILSRVKNALSGMAGSVAGAVSENMSLASIADKLGLVTEAEAEETELDLDDAVYMAFLDSEFEKEYRKFDFDHYQTDSNGETTAVFALTDVPYGLTIYVKETMPATNYGLDENTWSFSASDASLKYVTSTDPQEQPDNVYIAMEKTLDIDQDLTGTEYSMEGIEYIVYTDADCTEQLYWDADGDDVAETAAVLTLSANGVSNTIGPIDIGTATEVTYYIKENATKLAQLQAGGQSTGIKLDTGSHSLTAVKDEKTTLYFEVEDDVVTGSIYVYKYSSDATITGYYVYTEDEWVINDNYSLEGAEFGLYYDAGCSQLYDSFTTGSTKYTDPSGLYTSGSLTGIPIGTYYLKEINPPTGYEADVDANGNPNVYTVEITTTKTVFRKYIYDKPKTGSIEIRKYSSDSAYILDESGGTAPGGYSADDYTLEGAVFGVYRSESDAGNDVIGDDGTGTLGVAYLTTNADGYAGVSDLALGTYYVKETKASKGFKINSETNKAVLISGNSGDGKTYTIPVAETPNTVTLSVVKSSADPDATDNNDNYTLEGAVFGIFSDEACSTLLTTMTTNVDGKAASKDLAVGTYYIQEMQAPEGFELNSTIYKAACTASSVTYTNLTTGVSGSSLLSGDSLSITEDIETGKLRVYKESDDRDLTEYLDTYTLGGAVYGVYASASDASGDVIKADGTGTLGLGYLTTDEFGETEYLEGLAYGTYYVKETLAPAGFELDTVTHAVNVTSETVNAEYAVELDVTDDSTYYGGGLEIYKKAVPAEGLAEIVFPDNTMEGTQFTVLYYDGQYASQAEIEAAGAAPTAMWVLNVLSDGNGGYVTKLSDEKDGNGNYIYLQDVISDALYYDKDGNVIIPVGTITIEETVSPAGYTLDGSWYDADGNELVDDNGDAMTVVTLNITQDSNGSTAALTRDDEEIKDEFTKEDSEDVPPCSVRIRKQDDDGNALKGVTFTLYMYDEDLGDHVSIGTATTDEDGIASFEELTYGEKYRLVETAAVDGMTLLAEPIEFELPYMVSVEAVEAMDDVDLTNASMSSDGTVYYFRDITYTVSNSVTFELPKAGVSPAFPVALGIGAAVSVFGLYMLFKRRKKTVATE
ncbi:MAG: BspA family leucine-rich repeat surface protein [Clostridiales bacterium]|nr:BspA family leucine-rich repeat surface protein [Clostridiales bacterium]